MSAPDKFTLYLDNFVDSLDSDAQQALIRGFLAESEEQAEEQFCRLRRVFETYRKTICPGIEMDSICGIGKRENEDLCEVCKADVEAAQREDAAWDLEHKEEAPV